MSIFGALQDFNKKPKVYQFYTADKLWTDEYISARMLEYHLDESLDICSRRPEFIDRSVEWLTGKFKLDRDSRICDFGCGPGLYASRLARIGASVTGIDFWFLVS